MFVIYTGPEEVLICTEKFEADMLADFFNAGRDLEDYDRTTQKDCVQVTSRIRVD